MAKTIKAKYPGQCAACGQRHIKAGDTITLHPQGGWALQSCPIRRKSPQQQSRIFHKAVTSPDAPPPKPRFNNDEVIIAERAKLKRLYANEDYSWMGVEEFY